MAAAEVSLLDVTARAYGIPVYEMLGGLKRPALPVSWVAFIRDGEGIEEEIREKLSAEFLRGGLKIPSPDELIRKAKVAEDTARKILRLMVREGVLVKITDDLLIHKASMDSIIQRLQALKDTAPKLGVGEFKDLAEVSRKYAIPILEYLDRQRVTKRVGDSRVIL